MQNSTVEEYRFIRTEIDAVKACITTYTGYVLGGSGAAVLGLGALYRLAPEGRGVPELSVAAGCFALSILPTLVFTILLYKFHSHNRYAAYCRLLGNEKPVAPETSWDHLVPWEYCMGTLRYCDDHPDEWAKAWEGARFGGKNDTLAASDALAKYGPTDGPDGPRWAIDAENGQTAVATLWACMTGSMQTRSWTFPVYITSLFAWIVIAFLFTGLLFGAVAAREYRFALVAPTDAHSILLLVGAAILSAQAWMWHRFARSVNSVLLGSATVNAYSWRFLPLRVQFLNAVGIEPSYVLLGRQNGPVRPLADRR